MPETQQTSSPSPQTAPLVISTSVAAATLPAGNYSGAITGISVRPSSVIEEGEAKPIAYADLTIREDASGTELTYGLPLKVMADGTYKVPPKGNLAATMALFGSPLAPGGQPNDLTQVFVGRRVAFSVQVTTGSQGGTFSDVLKGSLRPL